MDNSEWLIRMRNMIAHGEIDFPIREILAHSRSFEDQETYERLLISYARYKEWKEKDSLGLIDRSYSYSFKNRIIHDLLQMTERFDVQYEKKQQAQER